MGDSEMPEAAESPCVLCGVGERVDAEAEMDEERARR